MHTHRLALIPLGGLVLLTAACTFPSSSRTLPASQVGQLQKVTVATVIRVNDVVIDGQKTALGQYGGAVIGGAVAMPAGGIGGRGDIITTAVASIAGAVAGQAVEEVATRKKAQEITVEMKNGDVFTIIQESPPRYKEGDRVNVIHSPNGARVELALDF